MTEFRTPFSPYIMTTTVSPLLVDILNASTDETLRDPARRRDADFSGQLLGKVSHEMQVILPTVETRDKVVSEFLELGVEYLTRLCLDGAAHEWFRINGEQAPNPAGLQVTSSWVVSQFKGEYNPCHHHSGDLSCIIYTALPEGYQAEIDAESETHGPANGFVEFFHGERDLFRVNSMKFRPEVGKAIIFPSSMRHFVYPFYCDGERRCVDFNLDIIGII